MEHGSGVAPTADGFEAWCKKQGLQGRDFDKNSRGDYIAADTALAWELWKHLAGVNTPDGSNQ